MNTCMLVHAQHQFLVFANKTTRPVDGACGHVSAYGLISGCAHALLSMWVHAYFFSAICNERWALISVGDICESVVFAFAVILTPFPLSVPSNTTLGPNIPRVLFPSRRPFGGDSLPRSTAAKLMIGARQRRICLSSCSSLPAPWPAKI